MADEDDEYASQVRGALFKGVLVVLAIAVVIAVGTTVLVRALGLNNPDDSDPAVGAPVPTSSPLPTTALPSTGEPTEESTEEPSPSDDGSESATGTATSRPLGRGAKGFVLEVSPVIVSPMERINLTGTYRGADNVQLVVQRREGGAWSDFGVAVPVRLGTFATYVMTGRTGDNEFRILDPAAGKHSNAVRVTIQ